MSRSKRTAPFGSWPSPISAHDVAAQGARLSDLRLDPETGALLFIERRPWEQGRCALVEATRERAGWQVRDRVEAPWNVRTRAHEYGGAPYLAAGGVVWFSHFADGRVYRQPRNGGEPRPITSEGRSSYADFVLDARRDRVLCVRERPREGKEPESTIVALSAAPAAAAEPADPVVLVSGQDFFSDPRLSPDGGRLAWLSWSHPDMPWDATTLWCADLGADGMPGEPRRVAGGPRTDGSGESIFQPLWSPDGVLHFVSDRDGYWRPYRLGTSGPEALTRREAEFGLPQWVFGMSTYAIPTPELLVTLFTEEGLWRIARLRLPDGELEPLTLEDTALDELAASPTHAFFVAASARQPTRLLALELATSAHERAGIETVYAPTAGALAEGYLSVGEPMDFPTAGGEVSHAFYYPPTSADFTGPEGERPPLLVKSHGGPTAATGNGLDPGVQFWTSRGFAVVDVNYRGSTGYGTAYRRALEGQWGIADVDDCVAAAQALVERGLADPDRLAIRGGSAGGFTTLAALAFRDTFRAGASHYGVGDLEALVRDTHKFESRYLDRLIGPYPERRDLYRQRSPLHSADRVSCPVIFFQGLDDKVVPPNQAESMVASLRERGVPVAYVTFAGEGHGFRSEPAIVRALEAELSFYGQVFDFEPAGDIEPVALER
ncbi:MAG TPA: S9 family peptidase [Thermoanaerobaculia bacterium]|nr:S9 family peptidase [Thermoanaerobaculia bacterium]